MYVHVLEQSLLGEHNARLLSCLHLAIKRVSNGIIIIRPKFHMQTRQVISNMVMCTCCKQSVCA